MVTATVVRQRKGQHVVAVPATVARHLVMATGTRVYWAMPRTGQALLSVKPTAARGTERRDTACPSCAAYRKEIERLQAKLLDRPLRVLNQGVAQGWGQAQRHLGVTSDRLDTIVTKLDEISARLPFGRTRRGRVQRAQRPVDVIPSPVLSSLPSSSGGGAGTSGAEPPGAPPSTEQASSVTGEEHHPPIGLLARSP